MERAVAEFGRLDTVVNNAGIMLLGSALRSSVEDWERMVALNVMGALYVTHAALPHLVSAAEDSNGGSRIWSTSAPRPDGSPDRAPGCTR